MNLSYSILMSVYYKERPEWLTISIESMLNQTLKANEFVIIKDGPLTDELEAVLGKYTVLYPQLFKIISLKQNVGLGPALAIGIQNCKNELIARMDSDDYSASDRCEKQLAEFAKDPTLDVVGCYESEFEDNLDNVISIHRVPETPDEIKNFMRRRCALLHPTVIYKKSAVLACGNYQRVPLYEDYDLFMRMVQNGARCYNLQQSLYFIRINPAFFKRRGGIQYMKTAIAFKKQQYQKKYVSLFDYIISAGSQAVVCLMPNYFRTLVYKKLLRG